MEINDLIRHYLYLERLASGGVNNVVTPSMQRVYAAINALLNQQDVIASRAQLNALTRAITQAVNDNSPWLQLTDEYLQPLADYEAEWQYQFMRESFGDEIAQASIDAQSIRQTYLDLSEGRTVGTWLDLIAGNDESNATALNNIVTRAFVRGEPLSVVKREIKQTINGIVTRHAETLARTGFVHYAAQAHEVVIQQNTDIVDEYYYIVTFDNRTSNVCIGITKFNDVNNRFSIDDRKAPQPPLHPNCRTRRIAVPKGFILDGTRTAVGGKAGEEAAERFAEKERRLRKASQVRYKGRKDQDIFEPGQIDASIGYEAWLKAQPRWFIEDTLGPKRATLLMDKGVSLKKFSDMQGRPLTLAEIAQREGVKL